MADSVHVKIDQKAGTFTITGKLNPNPVPSKTSGKQLMIFTTGGTREAEGDQYQYKVEGQTHSAPVKVNLNLGVDNPGFKGK